MLARFSSLLAELVPGGWTCIPGRRRRVRAALGDAGEQEARDLIGRVRAALEGNIDPLLRSLTASFESATNGRRRGAPTSWLPVADEAMYAAKRTGTGIEVAA